MQEHEVTSQATHLNLLLEFVKQWKAQLGSGLGSGPMALERNLSDLQLQASVEVAGDLEVDCYRAPCSESQEELALQHFMKEKLLADLEGKLRVFENIVAVLNKEVEASQLALAASIHQSQLDRELILSLEQRVSVGNKVAFKAGSEVPCPILCPEQWISFPPNFLLPAHSSCSLVKKYLSCIPGPLGEALRSYSEVHPIIQWFMPFA